MADEDFDEHGIYRERAARMSQNGILVDEDGIWRDDLDHLSHYTYRTDSGLGTTVGRKSSLGPLSHKRDHDLDGYPLDVQYPEDSYPMDERSLNISELEGSGSVVGDYSFDHESVDSGDDIELPELNDSDLNVTGDQSRFNSLRLGSSDFEGPDGPVRRPQYSTCQSDFLASRTKASDFNRSSPYSRYNGTYKIQNDAQISATGNSSKKSQGKLGHHQTKIKSGIVEQNNPLAYMLTSAEQRKLPVDDNDDDQQVINDQAPVQEQAVGDSLFTQDDPPPPILSGHQPSLVEFEQLEAAMQYSDVSGDQMDLIGAYLRGLQDQDEWDEQQNFGTGYLEHQYVGEKSRANQWHKQLQEEFQYRADEDEDIKIRSVSMEEETSGDSDQNGYQKPKQKSRMIRSDAVENHDGREVSGPYQTNSSHEYGSIQFEDSHMENQNSLGASEHAYRKGSRDSIPEGPGTPRSSRIPQLRCRSPSMSRPGSSSRPRSGSSPSTSRPQSQGRMSTPDTDRSRSKGRSGRRLPSTPGRSGSGSRSRSNSPGQSSDIKSRSNSASMAGNRPSSGSSGPDIFAMHSPDHNVMGMDRPEAEAEEESGLNDTSVHNYLRPPKDPGRPKSSDRFSNKSRTRARPQSAEPLKSHGLMLMSSSRPSTPHHFRVRSQSTTSLAARQPLKATHDLPDIRSSTSMEDSEDNMNDKPRHDLASRFIKEKKERKQNEETLLTLQQEYNVLLQKYAQAENTIDSLRIGAKIPINLDVNTSSQQQGGAMVAGMPQPGGSGKGTNLNGSFASLISAPGQLGVVSAAAARSRPGSAMSHRSEVPRVASATPAMVATVPTPAPQGEDRGEEDQESAIEDGALTPNMTGEGVKLSLLAKSKAVEEQTSAFEILLAENHLTLDDQQKALENMKNGYENLQQDYRDSREKHDFIRRQGKSGMITPFDEAKEVEGELYKLGMRLDGLEHQVQENQKTQTSLRKPFQGSPMKADHSIGVTGVGAGRSQTHETSTGGGSDSGPTGLPSDRAPSGGSLMGGPRDMDEKLHQLDKDYNDLMDHYRRLKGMKTTPENDQEVQGLLEKLRNLYEQTPEHRKPALPPELENLYNARDGSFMPQHKYSQKPGVSSREFIPESARLRSPEKSPIRMKQRERRSSMNDSDMSTSPERGLPLGVHNYDYGSSASSASRQRRKRYGERKGKSGSLSSLTDSLLSVPSQKTDSSIVRHLQRRPLLGPRRGDREDKDSGYVGSESSRKFAGQQQQHQDSKKRLGQSVPGGQPSGPKSLHPAHQDSNEIHSVSDASTVEHKPFRPVPGSKHLGKKTGSLPSAGTSILPSKPMGRPKSGHDRNKSGPVSHKQLPATPHDMDYSNSEDSLVSGASSNTRKSSLKSEQVRTLAGEVQWLKQQLQKQHSKQEVAGTGHTNQVQTVATGNQQQPQYVYYPYPNTSQGQEQQQLQEQELQQQQQQLQQLEQQHNPYGGNRGSGTAVPDHFQGHHGSHVNYHNVIPAGQHSYHSADPYQGQSHYQHPAYDEYQAAGHYRDYDAYREEAHAQGPDYVDHHHRNYHKDLYDGASKGGYYHDSYGQERQGTHRDGDRYKSDRGHYRDLEDDYRSGYHSDGEAYSRDRYSTLREHYTNPSRARPEIKPRPKSAGVRRSSYGGIPTSHPRSPYAGRRILPDVGLATGFPPHPNSLSNRMPMYNHAQPNAGYPHQGYVSSAAVPAPVTSAVGYNAPIASAQPAPAAAYGVTVPQVHSVPSANPAGATLGQPSCHVHSSACPMCGGAGYHTHGEYVYGQNPTPALAQAVSAPAPTQAPVLSSTQGTSYIAVPANSIGVLGAQPSEGNVTVIPANNASFVASQPAVVNSLVPQAASVANGSVASAAGAQGYIAVPVVSMQQSSNDVSSSTHQNANLSGSKIRYYIREYGAEEEKKNKQHKQRPRSRSLPRTPRRNSRASEEESSSESGNDELNDSLVSAMKTAKHLRQMSRKMKKNLKGELVRSYHESPVVTFLV